MNLPTSSELISGLSVMECFLLSSVACDFPGSRGDDSSLPL